MLAGLGDRSASDQAPSSAATIGRRREAGMPLERARKVCLVRKPGLQCHAGDRVRGAREPVGRPLQPQPSHIGAHRRPVRTAKAARHGPCGFPGHGRQLRDAHAGAKARVLVLRMGGGVTTADGYRMPLRSEVGDGIREDHRSPGRLAGVPLGGGAPGRRVPRRLLRRSEPGRSQRATCLRAAAALTRRGNDRYRTSVPGSNRASSTCSRQPAAAISATTRPIVHVSLNSAPPRRCCSGRAVEADRPCKR